MYDYAAAPASIQPWGSVKSDAENIPVPLPEEGEAPGSEEPQDEDCLHLSIYINSKDCINDDGEQKSFIQAKDCPGGKGLPVLLFIHGGAYFLGSGNRPYYLPTELLKDSNREFIYVAINYRLGFLGFAHAQTSTEDLVPPNNGLYDQINALKWVRQNISAFGGDPDEVTVVGQSAGGESISLLSNSDAMVWEGKRLFKRAIVMSGGPVTMPSMMPEEHTENFRTQAEKVGVDVVDEQGAKRGIDDIVKNMIEIDVQKIRELAWVGLPCTRTELLPFEKPTMGMMRRGGPDAWRGRKEEDRVDAQIVGTTTYDGGISYNMMIKDPSRKGYGKAFVGIAKDVLDEQMGKQLCDLYDIRNDTPDPDALQRICLFESDIGFFFAALSFASTGLVKDTYFQIFDLPNPFPCPLAEQGKFATHTFDITSLLGGMHHEKIPKEYVPIVKEWRKKIFDFVIDGNAPCARLDVKGKGRAMVVDENGIKEVGKDVYLDGEDGGRRRKLMGLADKVNEKEGWDVLWVDVCRRFLMKGE